MLRGIAAAQYIFCLLQQIPVLEVVYFHRAADVGEGFGGFSFGDFAAFAEDFADFGEARFPGFAALAYRAQLLLHHVVEEFLDLHVAEASALVVRLEFVEPRVLRQELLEIFRTAERVEVNEDGVVLNVSRILRADVQRVGVHRHDLLAYLLRLLGEVDAVAERLAHLRLAVGARQAQAGLVVGEHDVRLRQGLAVDGVEFMDYLAALLEHRRLILADGYDGRAEGRDVRRLAYRVAEEADGDARFEVAHLDFRLDGRVALDARDGDEVHVVEGQLGELRYHRLDEDGRLLGVDSAGEVVERYLEDVAADFLGVLGVVGERLRVGYHYVDFVEFPGVLERHAALERAYVMSNVEAARRAVAGQYYLSHRMLLLAIYRARRNFPRGP